MHPVQEIQQGLPHQGMTSIQGTVETLADADTHEIPNNVLSELESLERDDASFNLCKYLSTDDDELMADIFSELGKHYITLQDGDLELKDNSEANLSDSWNLDVENPEKITSERNKFSFVKDFNQDVNTTQQLPINIRHTLREVINQILHQISNVSTSQQQLQQNVTAILEYFQQLQLKMQKQVSLGDVMKSNSTAAISYPDLCNEG